MPASRREHRDERILFHADVDAFFAAVEQRDDPSLRGRPVVVGGAGPRGVVAAASYEARVFGIHSAMPSIHARRLCPDAVFVPGDMRKYRRESRRVFEIFHRYSPRVEGLSVDEAFLDMTGTTRLLGSPRDAAERLRAEVRTVTGLAISVGVGPVKMVAKIASDMAKPDGLLIVPRDGVAAFLAPLPVRRIWGVGPVAGARLETLGYRVIGDLAAASTAALRKAVGEWGVGLGALARGEDDRMVEPERDAKSYGEESTFERDVSSRSRLEAALLAHADAVARRLRRDRIRGRRVTVKIKLARPLGAGRYPLLTRAQTLATPTDDGDAIAAAARQLLARAALREPVRLIGVAVSTLSGAPDFEAQLTLPTTDAASRRRDRLNRAVDAIRERYGDAAVHRGVDPTERAGLTTQIKRGE